MPKANDVQRGPMDPTRALQRKLYRAAKQNKNRRFHALYDKVHRTDVLRRAWEEVARKGGAAGVDGIRIEDVEEAGEEEFLKELASELAQERYHPRPVRRVTIPKRQGGERHLGVPTVRDRVVQTAVKLVTEPVFEADFAECSYGFRPRQSARQARDRVRRGMWRRQLFVVDADIRSFFDQIDQGLILALVRERISDRRIVGLIAAWLRAGVMAGNSLLHPEAGTPQGGVISAGSPTLRRTSSRRDRPGVCGPARATRRQSYAAGGERRVDRRRPKGVHSEHLLNPGHRSARGQATSP